MSKMVDEEIQSIKVELKGGDDKDEYIEGVVDEWLNRIGELDIMSGKQFLEEYVENIGVQVVKRDWFSNGRLIKYIFRFKDMNVDWKRVERELIGGKKNSIKYLSNKNLNARLCSLKGRLSVTLGRLKAKSLRSSWFILGNVRLSMCTTN